MVAKRNIVEQVPELLAELSGIQPERLPPSGSIDLLMRLGDVTLVIETKLSNQAGSISTAAEQVAAAAEQVDPKAIGVVVTPFMGELGRKICEDAGVGYLDLSGNVHIKAPPLLLHVEGRRNRFVARGRPSSVFAPKSSRVSRLLLLDPERWWIQKDLARAGDLGPGYVSRICKRLESERLIERNASGALRPRDPNLLLDSWRSHYDFDRHEILRGHVAVRSGQQLVSRIVEVMQKRQRRYAVTGLAAAWLLAPFARYRLVAVYLEQTPSRSLLEELKCRHEERGANLWLVQPNDEGVFHGADAIGDVPCVTPVQAFIDLRAMPERSDEAAEHLRNKHLRWQPTTSHG